MFALSDILMWLFVFLLVWQGMVLIQFFGFLYFKFKDPKFTIEKRVDIDEEIKRIVQSQESFLFSKGFESKGVLSHDGAIAGSDFTYHQFYYYHKEQGIHAYIETQPYAGAVTSAVIYYNTFYESGNICSSANFIGFALASAPEDVYFFDHSLGSNEEVYASHLDDRVIDNETIVYNAMDMEGYGAFAKYMHRNYMDSYMSSGMVKQVDGGHKFTFSLQTWNFAKNFVKGRKEAIVKSKNIDKAVFSLDEKSSEAIGLEAQLDAQDKTRGEGSKKSLFFLSLAAFVLIFLALGVSFLDIGMIIVILFIHEAGHYLAMKFFGYKDISILFMPFGAVTIGKKEYRTAFEEFVVSMAGPLPGMIIGAMMLIAVTQYDVGALNKSYLNTYAMMSIIINYINLLPIYPLDGGRIMQTLLLSKYPKGQFYFYLISLGVLIIGMVLMQDYFLFIFVVILALALKQNYKISKILQKLFGQKEKEILTKKDVVEMLAHDSEYNGESLVDKTNMAKQVMYVINTGKPSRLLLTLGMAMYLFLLAPVFAMGFFGLSASFSEYANLSKETKSEIRSFHKNVNKYRYLTVNESETYTLKESQRILDIYLPKRDANVTIGEPLRVAITSDKVLPCEMPSDLAKVYAWHNGIEGLLSYSDLYGYEKMKKNYQYESLEYGDSNQSVAITSYDEQSGLAYVCGKEGLYKYPTYADEEGLKVYYSVNHFLKVTAEAYKTGAYHSENGYLYIDQKKLHDVKRKYLSAADKKRDDERIAFLAEKAQAYSRGEYQPYLKKMIINEMTYSYDERLTPSIALFLHDEEKSVAELAEASVNEIEIRPGAI